MRPARHASSLTQAERMGQMQGAKRDADVSLPVRQRTIRCRVTSGGRILRNAPKRTMLIPRMENHAAAIVAERFARGLNHAIEHHGLTSRDDLQAHSHIRVSRFVNARFDDSPPRTRHAAVDSAGNYKNLWRISTKTAAYTLTRRPAPAPPASAASIDFACVAAPMAGSARASSLDRV